MNRANLLKLILIPTLALPLATTHAATKTVWKDGINYVAIQSKENVNHANHPYTLDTLKLARILSQVTVQVEDKDSISTMLSTQSKHEGVRVFTNKEIDVLAQGISDALTQVSLNEAVTFSVSDFRPVYFGDKRLSVSGTAFIQNKQLNLLFGEIHVDLQKKYVRSGQGVSNSRFASNVELAHFKLPTGDLNKETDHNWQLNTFSGAQMVNSRGDWISVDLAKSYDYQETKDQSKAIQNKYLSNAQKNRQEQNDAAIEARLKRLEAATQTTALQTQKHTHTEGSVEARLKQVKSLYEQGVIPESVYLKKMNAIISEL